MHPEDSRAAARLTELYDAHSTDTFRYALHLTGRREDAEDVVQFVFLQAYGMLESGRELMNPRAWLIRATKHRSLNLIRDRRESPTADVRATAAHEHDRSEAEALAEVRGALWSLPETQHHAFVLRHWSGLSQTEIADVLATTPSAVESLLVRARTTLLAERTDGESECAGVRQRLVQMIAPTPPQTAHIESCRRCRTAQTRLLRAAEFATAFALVPRPQVAHALAAIIPGFGAHTLAAGATATGGAAGGVGVGGATVGSGTAMSAASAATKLTVLTKVALAATTAAVALTAVHPVRSAVTHALLGHPSARAADAVKNVSRHRPAGKAASPTAGSGAAQTGTASPPGAGGGQGKGATHGKSATAGSNGSTKGKSGTAGSNGAGKGKSGAAAGNGAAKGQSASAPGKTKAASTPAAAGKGKGTSKPNPDPGGTKGAAGGTGKGAAGGNAGGNGKGNGKS